MKNTQLDEREIEFKLWRIDYWEKHHSLPNSEMILKYTEVIL